MSWLSFITFLPNWKISGSIWCTEDQAQLGKTQVDGRRISMGATTQPGGQLLSLVSLVSGLWNITTHKVSGRNCIAAVASIAQPRGQWPSFFFACEPGFQVAEYHYIQR